MHVLERFALSTGAKIKSPFIYESFYPNFLDKYITMHPFSHPSKSYDHWNEVVEILLPYLSSKNISVLQIGENKDSRIANSYSANQSTINQTAYIINHSLLHMGIDAFPIHVANKYGKKIVGLYSHVLPSHHGPYWGNSEDHILLQPERKSGEKPSYSHEEIPKSINTILPEKIAESVCKLLDIDFDYEYVTKKLNDQYKSDLIDVVPNTCPSEYGVQFPEIRVRMDLEHNEQGLVKILKEAQGKVRIVTNNPINLNIINSFKEKINGLIFVFDEHTQNEDNFIIVANSLGIEMTAFVSYLPIEQSNKIKLKYMDFILLNTFEHFTFKDSGLETTENMYCKSSKRILDKGKIYPNFYSYKKDEPVSSLDKVIVPVKEDDLFWRDLDYYAILEKKN